MADETRLEAIKARAAAANDDIGIAYSIPADEWVLTSDKPTMQMLRNARADVDWLVGEVSAARCDRATLNPDEEPGSHTCVSPTDPQREALAQALYVEYARRHPSRFGRLDRMQPAEPWWQVDPSPRGYWEGFADAILSSDLIREVKAEAWDEAADRIEIDGGQETPITDHLKEVNPYRQEADHD